MVEINYFVHDLHAYHSVHILFVVHDGITNCNEYMIDVHVESTIGVPYTAQVAINRRVHNNWPRDKFV